jgi:hypothetical protein
MTLPHTRFLLFQKSVPGRETGTSDSNQASLACWQQAKQNRWWALSQSQLSGQDFATHCAAVQTCNL